LSQILFIILFACAIIHREMRDECTCNNICKEVCSKRKERYR